MPRLNLPILQGTQTPNLLRQAIHLEDVFQTILGEETELECGSALMSSEFSDVFQANQIRLATDPENKIDQAAARGIIAEVNDAFAKKNLQCRLWHFENGLIPPAVQAELIKDGFVLEEAHLWAIHQTQPLETRKDLMVLPGRAAMGKVAQLARETMEAFGVCGEAALNQQAIMALRHLDDPAVDNLLVLQNDEPAGMGYLAIAGQAGLITDFYVHPKFQRQGVGVSLLERMLELAARSRLRHVLLFCEDQNEPAKALYAKAGFVPIAPVAWMTKS